MDVHTTNYTLCCYSIDKDEVFAVTQVSPDYKNVLKYLSNIRMRYDDCHFLCGYEAGCLGYSLYHQLTDSNVDCVILAPTTMAMTAKKGIKNDKRDAANIAKCLAYNTYSPVYVLSDDDVAVREYIRMRNDVKITLKKIKQQLLSFCTRHGKHFTEGRNYWTQKHLGWMEKVDFGHAVLQETFQEYLILYRQACEKIDLYDKRIEELAQREEYADKVNKLKCFIGIKTYTALSLIVEIGDFKRFPKAQNFTSFIGLIPGEVSSGNSLHRMGITKAGNSHVRSLLVEAAQSYSRGAVGKKSKTLTSRQAGNEPKVIAYADKANERLKRKFYRINFKSKRNIAVVAVARELACFIWGMMTDNVA
jgi:transposase